MAGKIPRIGETSCFIILLFEINLLIILPPKPVMIEKMDVG